MGNKQWHEFGETLLQLVFLHRNYDYSELIYAVFQQLNTKLDIYVVLQLVEIFILKENTQIEEAFKLLENQRPLTKGTP